MSGPRLIALKCPRCREPLPARAGELLFFCAKCPTAVEPADDGVLHPLPLQFEAGDCPWWLLAGKCRVQKFSATRPAKTPFGMVSGNDQAMPVRFLIPADERPIADTYRAALGAANEHPGSGERGAGPLRSGVLSRRAAEQVARQVLLTLVARADGKIHLIQFDLDLPDPSIVIRAR